MATFQIGSPDDILDMAECEDLDWEVLGPLFDEEFTDINASTTTDEALREMATALQEANPVIAPNPPKRFKSLTEEDLLSLQESKQSQSTKRNTKWGVNVFQGTQNMKMITENFQTKVTKHLLIFTIFFILKQYQYLHFMGL